MAPSPGPSTVAPTPVPTATDPPTAVTGHIIYTTAPTAVITVARPTSSPTSDVIDNADANTNADDDDDDESAAWVWALVVLLLVAVAAGFTYHRWSQNRALNSLFKSGAQSRSMSVKERASIANPTFAAAAAGLLTYEVVSGTPSNQGSASENPTYMPVGGAPPFVSPIYHIPTEGGDDAYLEVTANNGGISAQPMYRTLDPAEAGQRGIVAQPAYSRLATPATPFETPTYQILAQPTRGAGPESVYNKLRTGSVANGVEATTVSIEAALSCAESSPAYATAGLVGPDGSSDI